MSDLTTELQGIHDEFCKAAIQFPDLAYVFLEAVDREFPTSALQKMYAGQPHECLEVFDLGDHQAAHVVVGTRDAIGRLRQLSARAISCTPAIFRRSYLGESSDATLQWIHAILALDSAIGTHRFGRYLLWFDAKNPEGATESAVSNLGFRDAGNEKLVPDSLRAGLARQGNELVHAIRTLRIDSVFDASSCAIDQLLIRQDMPPYFDNLQPTYSQMVKLVWEIDDLTRAIELAGLLERDDDTQSVTLGSEGDCGLMLAAMGIQHQLNPTQRPWDEIGNQVRGWNGATFEAIRLVVRLMEQLYAIYGWSVTEKSMPVDRAKMPKVPTTIHRDLKNVAVVLRRDGLEELHRDAKTLGTPKATAFHKPLRVYVDQIDNFDKVKAVSNADVEDLLDADGVLKYYEDDIQVALEQVLGVPFHKKDWPGEENDLYAPLDLEGHRVTAAFALNGRGKVNKILQLSNCGKNGDQIVRLFQSPADLFVLQSVGPIAENLVKDVADKTLLKRLLGRPGHFCIIDGQETARILRAYDKLG
jgi:hypothetical protein